MNMKIVMEAFRNSQETPSTQNLIILRNFQCWPKFLVSYKKIHVQADKILHDEMFVIMVMFSSNS